MRTLRKVWTSLVGKSCPRCKTRFRSDFCPTCTRAMAIRLETQEHAR